MKKYVISIVILLACMISLGCGKKEEMKQLECFKTEKDEKGYKTNTSMLISSKNGKVVKIDTNATSEVDPDTIDLSLSFGNSFATTLNEINGIEVSYEKVNEKELTYHMIIDFENLDLESLKSKMGESLEEDSFYFNKDISLEEFQKENLSGFTCK